MNKKLTAAFTLLSFFVLTLTTHAQTLSDIQNHQNQRAIEFLYNNNVIGGYPDGTFQPDKTINRAELIKILVGGKGITPSVDQYHDCFPDVKTEWFAPYVCYAKEMQWVGGYPDGTFQPSKTVNKVEAIKMLINSQGIATTETVDSLPYSDVPTDQWFAKFIKVANDKGMLEQTNGEYQGAADMTRGSISESIYRAMINASHKYTSFNEYNPYKVTKVVDGDTIAVEINGESTTLRLIGIDTPESVHPNKPVQCFAIEASSKAKEILTDKWVSLEKDETQDDKDKYDRLLRYVILENGNNFNKIMIEQGYAHEYTYNTPYKYQEEFKAAQKNAEELKLGLWADETCAGNTEEASLNNNITNTPIPTIEINPTPISTPIVTPTPVTTVTYGCSQNIYNCSSFNTQAEAQAAYNYCMAQTGTDIHKLDQDGDGAVCESLN